MTRAERSWEGQVLVHSLAWLVVGGAAGLLLSVLLLFPSLGGLIEPLSYGRWIPVHFNSQLYGWLGLPLVGLLFRFYLPRSGADSLARIAVSCWSGSLLFAIVTWLGGHSGGKLFLEWTGPSRLLLAISMAVLGCVLAIAFRKRRTEEAIPAEPRSRKLLALAKWSLLLLLFAVPPVIYWASGPGVYPAINPDSGGATGRSLLGSTLAVVAIVWLTPWMAGARRKGGPGVALQTGIALMLHVAAFASLDHGNHSHHEISQIVGLASLVIWPPLLLRYLRRFEWLDSSRRWLAAFCGWGTLLVATAVPMFLPGILEALKYTNALVGHAHLAMAGMATSFVVIVLISLGRGTGLELTFSDRAAFGLWHVGLVVHILALTVLGAMESSNPGLLYRSDAAAQALYTLRLAGGLSMFLGSLRWIRSALRVLWDDRRRVDVAGEAARVAI